MLRILWAAPLMNFCSLMDSIKREWNLTNNNLGILETNTDFGFGTYNESTDDAPEELGGYINESYPEKRHLQLF